MIAFKCDRCGKLFGVKSRNTGELYITKCPAITNCFLDLCSECSEGLQEWFESTTTTEDKAESEE